MPNSIDIHDDRVSNPGANPHFNELIPEALDRRTVLRGGLGAAAAGFFGASALGGCNGSDKKKDPPPSPPPPAERVLGFTALPVSSGDAIVVPSGYVAETILPWGEPISPFAPAWNPDASQGWEAQEQQVGDNHDGMTFFPLDSAGNAIGNRSDEGLLVMNHEYINPEYFYKPDTDPADWMAPFTFAKAKKALAAHGVSVNHVRRLGNGTWTHVKTSPFNRRITGYTPMLIDGPAAGDPMLQTAADPAGTSVLGTLNNCANGSTPWGTYLTCEENFQGYFGWNGSRTPSALENRYGFAQNGFGYRWHTVDPRFDLNAHPNEPNRFGWVVEIDPFNPSSTPIKHTALGRFKHENAEVVVTPGGKVAAYLGDDERNDYLYKFVSDGSFDAADPYKPAHRGLLSAGTLYVARFDAGGTGTWLPLVYGTGGLDATNGFTSQADVLIRTRQAADRVGATMMDRPEWVTARPSVPGEVYLACTNNNRRGTSTASSNNPDGTTTGGTARPPIDEANPRAVNNWGQIVKIMETGGDGTATTFAWELFLIAGNPQAFPGDAKAGSSNITVDNMFNSPDGITFDDRDRLWIQTDGNYSNTGDYAGQGNNQMLAADPDTGEVRRFLTGPAGCEITGLALTPDRTTMFINVQHPGEAGSHPNRPAAYTGDNWIANNPAAFTTWPVAANAGGRPRSATVVIRRSNGGVVGEGDSPTTATATEEAPPSAAG